MERLRETAIWQERSAAALGKPEISFAIKPVMHACRKV